jgi:SdpC family antimicrobial peptide
MKRVVSSALAIAMLAGCTNGGQSGEDRGWEEGETPVGTYVELQSAEMDGFTLAKYDGKELFRGIILADGPVARSIPTIRDHLMLENSLKDPKALEAARELHERIIALVERNNPEFFGEFEQVILSGDHLEIAAAINRGRTLARDVLEEARAGTTLATDEKCLVAAVVVAVVAAHVVVAVNHALAHETVWVSSVTTGDNGDRIDIDQQAQALMVSEMSDDVASMQKVPVWEFTSATAWNATTAYTDKTKHKLVIGDFDGDGEDDDRFYYSPGGVDDDLVAVDAGDFKADMRRKAQPIVADFDGDKVDDILFFEAGKEEHYIWFWKKTNGTPGYTFIRFIGNENNISADVAKPAVGDFDGNGRADIFWYAPRTADDYMWEFTSERRYSSKAIAAGGNFKPIVGDFVGDNADDIVWYCPGSCDDVMWKFKKGTDYEKTRLSITINGDNYRPFVADFDNNGKHDIFWYNSGDQENNDSIWYWQTDDDRYTTASREVKGDYDPVTGKIAGRKLPTVFWWPNR